MDKAVRVNDAGHSERPARPGAARALLTRALPTLRSRFVVLLVALGAAGLLPLLVAHEAHTQAHGFAHRGERMGSLRQRLSEQARRAEDKAALERLISEQSALLSLLISGDAKTGLPACGSQEACARLETHLATHESDLAPRLRASRGASIDPALAQRVTDELALLDATVRLDARLSERRIDRIRRIGLWGTLGSLVLVGLVGIGVGEVFGRIRRLGSAVREGNEARIDTQARSRDEIATLARALSEGLRKERAQRDAERVRLAELTAQQAATRACTEALNGWLSELAPLEPALERIAQATGYRRAELVAEATDASASADERHVPLAWRGIRFGTLRLSERTGRADAVTDDALVDGFAQLLTIGCLARRLLDEREKRRQLAAAMAAAKLDALPQHIGTLLGELIPHDRATLRLLDERGRTLQTIAIRPGSESASELEIDLAQHGSRVGVLALGRVSGTFSGADEEVGRDIAPLLASALVRMQLEARLHEAQRWSALGAFGRHLAHELKNPINGLLLQLTLLERRCQRAGEEGQRLLEYTTAIRQEAKRLIELVDDSLAVLPTRVDGDRLENADLAEVVSAAIADLGPTFEASHTELVSQLTDTPAVVCGDGGKLRRVVRQLLDDSLARINGTEERRVLIGLDRAGDDWCLSIERTGPAYADAETLFTPGADGRAAGTGMELALCQWIARAFGGDVVAENPERGPRLTLTLRAAP